MARTAKSNQNRAATKRPVTAKRSATKRRLVPAKPTAFTNYLKLAIGSKLAGGLFAGITYADGKPYALVLGPEHPNELTWDQFDPWVKTLSHDGCTDFCVPSKLDGMLLFVNLRKEFKQAAYWLEQHAEYSSNAWFQDFSNGSQDYWRKCGKLRARAVRRLAI